MIFAFFRLFVIAIASVLIIFIIVLALRMMGERQVYSVPPHRLLNIHPFDVAWGGDSTSAPAFSLAAYQRAAKEHFVLGALVHVTRDGVWFVAANNNLAIIHKGTGWFNQADSKNLKGILRFSDLIKALPQANYYVQIDNPATNFLKHFFTTIENAKIEDHFVLVSTFTDTMKMVKDENPSWLIGSTNSDISSSWLMTSMYLEPIMSLDVEEFTLPLAPLPPKTNSTIDAIAVKLSEKAVDRLLLELQKRKILALVNSSDVHYAQQLIHENLASGAIFASNELPNVKP